MMFYEKLQRLCASRGLSITQFCKEVGLSNATASKWKQGAKPFHSSLYRISKFFDVEIEYLLDDEYLDYATWLTEVKGLALAEQMDNMDKWLQEKTATNDGLDDEFVLLAKKLSPAQRQRVMDFMRGVLA